MGCIWGIVYGNTDDLVRITATSYLFEGVLATPFTASTLRWTKQRETTSVKFLRKQT